ERKRMTTVFLKSSLHSQNPTPSFNSHDGPSGGYHPSSSAHNGSSSGPSGHNGSSSGPSGHNGSSSAHNGSSSGSSGPSGLNGLKSKLEDENKYFVFSKGAVESILEICDQILDCNDRISPISPHSKNEIIKMEQQMALRYYITTLFIIH